MDKPLVTSLSNPLIKQARALHQKKGRNESGLFLVEGIHHVGEAIAASWQVKSILYAPELLTSHFARDLISQHSAKSQPVSVQVMESLAGKENPQGIIAIVHQKESQLSNPSTELRISLHSPRISVALVAPQDPGNVGTILRTMDAVDAHVLFLLNSGVEVYHPTVVRASMGTIFWKPIVQSSFDEFAKWAHQAEYQIIGASAHGDVNYRTLVPQVPWILVLGNEQKGLSAEQMKACDVTVSLPMKGRVSSLNLSVAAGVLLYQFANKA